QHLAYSANLAAVLAEVRYLVCSGNVAAILLARNNLLEAIDIYKRIVPLMKKVSGSTGYDTLAAIMNHGASLMLLGNLAEAEPLLLEVHHACSTTLGESNERTIFVIEKLVELYDRMKNQDRVKEWQKVLESAKRKSK